MSPVTQVINALGIKDRPVVLPTLVLTGRLSIVGIQVHSLLGSEGCHRNVIPYIVIFHITRHHIHKIRVYRS